MDVFMFMFALILDRAAHMPWWAWVITAFVLVDFAAMWTYGPNYEDVRRWHSNGD